MASLDNAIFKLERAEKQLDICYNEILTTLNNNSVEVGIDKQSYFGKAPWIGKARKWTAYTAYFKSIPEMTKRHGLLLGETIQSFRISLDYLAWAFAMKFGGGLNKKARRNVYYPMAVWKKDFTIKLKKVLPNPTPEQWTFFQRFQPYKRTDEGRAVRHLNILSKVDKHRFIIPSLLYSEKGEINFTIKEGEVVTKIHRLNRRREINNNTKVMTLIINGITPGEGKVHVDLNTTLTPIFQKSLIKPPPPFEILTIEDGMNEISKVCTKIVSEAINIF